MLVYVWQVDILLWCPGKDQESLKEDILFMDAHLSLCFGLWKTRCVKGRNNVYCHMSYVSLVTLYHVNSIPVYHGTYPGVTKLRKTVKFPQTAV